MMCPQNVLFGYLPDTVNVGEQSYKIRCDFRTWLTVGEIMRKNEAPERRAAKIVNLCYIGEKPRNVGLAFGSALGFYVGAFPPYGRGEEHPESYSADFDGKVIYSGFMKCYGIDLSKSDMHWYCFAPLFYELSSCAFSKIMEYRQVDTSTLAAAQQKVYNKMKRVFALPTPFSDGDFADELYNAF